MNPRMISISAAILAMAPFFPTVDVSHAQDPGIRYRVDWGARMDLLEPRYNVFHKASFGVAANGEVSRFLVVGRAVFGGLRQGFVYDHMDAASPYTTLPELVPHFPPAWAPSYVESIFVDVNENGRVVGYLLDEAADDRIAFYIDINDATPTIQRIQPMVDAGFQNYRPSTVNDLGQMMIQLPDGINYFYDPDTSELIEVPLLSNTNGAGMYALNNLGQLSARFNADPDHHANHQIDDSDGNGISDGPTNVFSFPSDFLGTNINDLGESGGVFRVTQGPNRGRYPVRVDFDGNINWQGDAEGRGVQVNLSGDVLVRPWNSYQIRSTGINPFSIYHADDNETYEIMDWILDESDPDHAFRNGTRVRPGNDQSYFISERGPSGFPSIAGRIQPDGEEDWFFFVLTPVVPGQTPGISVVPAIGLVTTEAGGQDSFEIVLNTEPVDDVMIGISSSNSAEGTVATSSVTFTPADWNIPQSVQVTGVDDGDIDGDVAYTILTAAAVSTDLDYNGLNPADVGVVNLDDEQPPILTFSNNTPVAIPDPGTITSTINVPDSFTVADVNITLNIEHGRTADMDVFLIAPNGTRVELFTDVGGNGDDFIDTTLDDQAPILITAGSAPFTGSFCPEGILADINGSNMTGDWILELTDDRSVGGQNGTGTLLSWSLTLQAQ